MALVGADELAGSFRFVELVAEVLELLIDCLSTTVRLCEGACDFTDVESLLLLPGSGSVTAFTGVTTRTERFMGDFWVALRSGEPSLLWVVFGPMFDFEASFDLEELGTNFLELVDELLMVVLGVLLVVVVFFAGTIETVRAVEAGLRGNFHFFVALLATEVFVLSIFDWRELAREVRDGALPFFDFGTGAGETEHDNNSQNTK